MANFLKSLFVKGVEIDTTGASTGNVLSYNGTKFAPAAPGSGSLAFDDLSDVTITSPEKYQTAVYDGSAWINEYPTTVSLVYNAEATTLAVGEVVYIFGGSGNHASVKRADNDGDSTSAKTLGVVAESIPASQTGGVVTRGYVSGVDLSVGFTEGDTLYVGESGGFTKTKPYAPEHLVYVGVVVRATSNGIIYVATQNGYELDEIHNVDLITNAPVSGDFLKYNGTLWVNDAINLGTDTVGNYMSDISGTSPVSVSHTPAEGSSATVSLASGYGDTQNPYASKTANYFLASPNGSAGTPSFRAIVAADIPTLNQNTTGTASNITASSNTTLTSLANLATVGTITSGTWSGSFGSVSGANLTSLNASNLGSGTVPSARISGSYTSITAVGTLTSLTSSGTISGQIISGDDTNSPAISLRGWPSDSNWASVDSNRGYLLLGHASTTSGIYLRSYSTATSVRIGANGQDTLVVGYSGSAYTVTIAGEAYCSGWWRSTGQSGWYNQDYGGGIWMSDSSWVRVYGSKRFLADSGLNVGGTTNNSTLNVIGGTAWFSAMSTGGGSTVVNNFGFLQYVSSRRELKENIVTVNNNEALQRLLSLRPVEFTMKPEYVQFANDLTPLDKKRGFIAQEVAEVDHWYGQWGWVDENQMMQTQGAIDGSLPLEESTPVYWNHDAVIADLVATIQNLNARLSVLESNQ
jgi:hypothetical protein